ncbi:MAG TPA: SDR family oxidoreductase [Flavobacteriales bacterium]|nr:SDR family oxidoreductase [Flavobacteriales bacterium]
MKRKKNRVLVTGASSGIGFELAKIFAFQGDELIITARDEKQLIAVADSLKEAGSPKVNVIAKDLSSPGSSLELYNITKELGLEVNILVNNAGMAECGLFAETEIDSEVKTINLNIIALMHLTKLFLKDMLARNEGRILQLAAVNSYQPTPKLAVYAATKAFVLSLTDALIEELRGTNVTMTALIPGPTDTNFFNRAGMEHTRFARFTEDPALVAQIGYNMLMRGRSHAFGPGVRARVVRNSFLTNREIASMAARQMEAVCNF